MTTVPAPAESLHRRIRADLEAQIASGAWAPGYRIPTERDLTTRYGCARMTVSKAVQALVEAGLVERRKKAGSFVARPRLETTAIEIPDIAALIAGRGEAYAFRRLAWRIRPPTPGDADERALKTLGDFLAVDGLHLADQVPIALEHRVISLEAAPQARSLAFGDQAPGSWLLKHVPWTKARHRITAINPDVETVRLLGVPRTTACLSVERWTWRNGQGITFVRQIFPGDRYDLVATFGP